jgi:hypothetical protein
MHKLLIAFLVVVGLIILCGYFSNPIEESVDAEQFIVYDSNHLRPNCFRNIFGQKVCYPNKHRQQDYYYPYVRGDSTFIRRNYPRHMHYWNRY